MALDPVTAGFSFGEALTALITKTLPSDEQRLLAFKARYPRMYFRVKMHILRQSLRYLRHHREIKAADFVQFVGGQFTEEERTAFTKMIGDEVGFNE